MATLICQNCGASFDASEPKCPYCGHISYPGAEEKFMKDLNQIKEDLSDVSEIPKKNYKRAMTKQSKVVIITLVIVLCIAGIIAAFVHIFNKLSDTYFGYDQKTEMLWERETFPKLDKMYEDGDFQEILEFQQKMYEENNHHSLYNWEHYDYMQVYDKYTRTMEIVDKLDRQEELTKYEYEDIVYYVMWFHCKQYSQYQTYTEEESAKVTEYADTMEEIFYQRLKFTDEEGEELYQKCMKAGYFSMKPCFKYAGKVHERFE